MNLTRKSIPKSEGIKSKTITKLLDRFMDRGLKLWNYKKLTTTLTVPVTVRTAIGRDIVLDQNTCKNQCEETYKQGWLF